jgi:hypothetical protein
MPEFLKETIKIRKKKEKEEKKKDDVRKREQRRVSRFHQWPS